MSSCYCLSCFLQGCRTAGVSGPMTFIVTSLDANILHLYILMQILSSLTSENKLSHGRMAVSSVLCPLTDFSVFFKINESIEAIFIALIFLVNQDNLCTRRGWNGGGALH